jgi:hypothetical protein
MKTLLIILSVIGLLSCSKIEDKFNYNCNIMQLQQYAGSNCIDTFYIEISKDGITHDQQLYWLSTYPDFQIVVLKADTLYIKNEILGCGQVICQ